MKLDLGAKPSYILIINFNFSNCEAQSVSAGATDGEDARIFWDHSAKLVNLSKKEKEWIK